MTGESHGFDLNSYLICCLFSIVLMVLFVLVNYNYYQNISGGQVKKTLIRTIALNTVAIMVGWGPVAYLWPRFSLTVLLPVIGVVGALGCVGSRFIYPEIVPEALAQKLTEYIEKKLTFSTEKNSTVTGRDVER
ncbi:hypothetical protein CHISP_2916 [Chitinispirillum alkaliphilum]|nr:hypothetical protein CHISP_2916 [Chitinispirillum alkaliphilum]